METNTKKKTTTHVVMVSDRLIDWMLEHPPRHPSARLLATSGGPMVKALYDKDMAILQQYHDRGYAVEEIELRVDDKGNEIRSRDYSLQVLSSSMHQVSSGFESLSATTTMEPLKVKKEKQKKKKRTEVIRVDEWFIDMLLEKPHLPKDEDEDDDNLHDAPDLGLRERDSAKRDAILKVCYDRDMAILQQYHDKGCALMEIEVADDDDEEN